MYVNGVMATKPSLEVSESDTITYCGEAEKYVGRGGLKLDGAIERFNIDLGGLVCADLGASTGGFTDCMLAHGAKLVYAIDVGHDQLDRKLVDDPRVVNIEGVNVKDVTRDTVDNSTIDFVCADLSFISVRYAVYAAQRLLDNGEKAVLLIKPQFEAGKENISKGGIVKNKKVHIDVLQGVFSMVMQSGFSILGLTPSPIKGGDGNVEYLIYVEKSDAPASLPIDFKKTVEEGFDG